MKILKSKLFGWFPASLITTLFGLGRVQWWKEAWLAVFAGALMLLLTYGAAPFMVSHQPTLNDYGIILIRSVLLMFPLGWFALAVFEARRGELLHVVIDYVWGLFLALTLVLPSILYAAHFINYLMGYICGMLIECFPGAHYLGYLAAFAMPCTLYTYAHKWQLWPIYAIKRDIRLTLGNFLSALAAATYTTVVFSLLVFLLMRGDASVIASYWKGMFSHLVPQQWMGYLRV